MPSPYGGWRERGPCQPPTSHRPGQASPAGRYQFLFSWMMLCVCLATGWGARSSLHQPGFTTGLGRRGIAWWGAEMLPGKGFGASDLEVRWAVRMCPAASPTPQGLQKLKIKKTLQAGKNQIYPISKK